MDVVQHVARDHGHFIDDDQLEVSKVCSHYIQTFVTQWSVFIPELEVKCRMNGLTL